MGQRRPRNLDWLLNLLDLKSWVGERGVWGDKIRGVSQSIQADDLVWGPSKLVLIGYGIKNLQKQGGVKDDTFGAVCLEEQLTSFEDMCLANRQNCFQQDRHQFLLID